MDRVTHLDVSVQTDEGRPAEPAYVVVMPDDPGKWRLIESRYRRKTWAEGGKPVAFDALPPGRNRRSLGAGKRGNLPGVFLVL